LILNVVRPQRIGLWNGSYGGLLTAMGLARNSDIFKAGVDFHGVHDWATFPPVSVEMSTSTVAPEPTS
jgi:dipeptidyl aminopeptidase/acylaminoacyl peptidase